MRHTVADDGSSVCGTQSANGFAAAGEGFAALKKNGRKKQALPAKDSEMKNFLSKTAREITPYTAGEQPADRKYIKLNTNENPYPPSPKALKAYENCDFSSLKLYPPLQMHKLREAIAAAEGVEALKEVSGSLDEALRQYSGGIQSGLGYLGAHNLAELRANARYIRVSGAGQKESAPHDIIEVKKTN